MLTKTPTQLMIKNKVPKFKPDNGRDFRLREVFMTMKEKGIAPHNFYTQVTGLKSRRNESKLYYHRKTLIKRHNKRAMFGIFPKLNNYDSNVGAPQITTNKVVPLLNGTTYSAVGLS